MSHRRHLFVVPALALALPAAHAAEPGLKPGKWEITIRSTMAGMTKPMQPRTLTHCVTPEESKKGFAAAAQHGGPNQDCKMEDTKHSGDKFTWSMNCTGAHPATGGGEIEYSGGDHYTGVTRVHMESQGRTMDITTHVEGKYKGKCDEPK